MRALLPLFFVLLLGVPAASAPSTPDRARGVLDEVDQTVRREFYDPKLRGVDWKAEVAKARKRLAAVTSTDQMYSVIGDLLGTLRTSHTAIFAPGDPFYYFIGSTFGRSASGYERVFGSGPIRWANPGFLVNERSDGVFVESIFEGDTAARAGLQVGDRVLAVEGRPWRGMQMFGGLVGRKVVLRVQRARDGAPRSIVITPHLINPQEAFLDAARASTQVFERKGRRIGYIHLWAFSDRRVYDVFREALNGRLRRTDALVIDLRDGIGGDYPRLLYPLLPGVPRVEFTDRSGRTYTEGGPFGKPLVVIVNERSRSAKELYAYALRKLGAKLVGARTAGAVTAGRAWFLSDRSLLYLAVSKVTIEGQLLEGVGVSPDAEVARPIPYAAGRDPQLDRALELSSVSARPARASSWTVPSRRLSGHPSRWPAAKAP